MGSIKRGNCAPGGMCTNSVVCRAHTQASIFWGKQPGVAGGLLHGKGLGGVHGVHSLA